MIKQPKNSYVNGIKALSIHGIIPFDPPMIDLKMRIGTNVAWYRVNRPELRISTQIDVLIQFESILIESILTYSLERLFVDIDSFDLDYDLKQKAILNIVKKVDVTKVNEVIKIFEKHGIKVSQCSKEFVIKNDFIKHFASVGKDEMHTEVRKYIISRLYDAGINAIIKGESAVEIYIDKKSATYDIDAWSTKEELTKIIQCLKLYKDGIYFNVLDFNGKKFQGTGKHDRLIAIAFSRNGLIKKKVEGVSITIDLNYSFSYDELNEIKLDFNLKPQKIWKDKDKSVVTILGEMIIADKLCSCLSTCFSKQWRTKDFIDLYQVMKMPFDSQKIRKWLKIRTQLSGIDLNEWLNQYPDIRAFVIDNSMKIDAACSTYGVELFDIENHLDSMFKFLKE